MLSVNISYAVLRPRESYGEILLVGNRNRQTPPSHRKPPAEVGLPARERTQTPRWAHDGSLSLTPPSTL